MRYTTEIKLVNREDMIRAEDGVIRPEGVRQVIVKEALVDTGASRLSLPRSLIQQLGLTPVGKTRSKTANGEVDRTIYSEVEFTILGRADSMKVTDLPDDAPVLVGHLVMEHLDLCLDVKRGLIYNPAHGNEWIEEQYYTVGVC
ncbi:retropepsin-like domain-containing protein [Candidatus Poribacteria bacterium]|nr:retropepsin-like domain-containing protein [Candidatus Poribacteria bacterium]